MSFFSVPNQPAKYHPNDTESFAVNQAQPKKNWHEEMLYNIVFLDYIISNSSADVGPHILHDRTSKEKMIYVSSCWK